MESLVNDTILSETLATVFSSDKFATQTSDPDAYSIALKRWSSASQLPAKCIIFPKTAQDVSVAIKFYTSHRNDQGIELKDLAIKGGGHSTSGASSSNGGMVVDLGKFMNTAKVIEGKDKDGNVTKFIKAEGGSLLRAVNEAGAEHGVGCVAGVVDNTGIGGLTVGGGYGWLSPKYGLTIDALEEVEVVVANGDVVIANEHNAHSDLFWGVRGGGSNFGPVTSFTFRTFPLPSNGFWAGTLVFHPSQYDDFFEAVAKYKKVLKNSTESTLRKRNENLNVGFMRMPPEFQPALIAMPMVHDPSSIAEARSRFQPLFDLNPIVDLTPSDPSQLLTYITLNQLQAPMAIHGPRSLFKGASFSGSDQIMDCLGEVFKPVWDDWVRFTDEHEEVGKTPGSAILLEMGDWGKICEVGQEETAFPNRGPWYSALLFPRWNDPSLDTTIREWGRKMAKLIQDRALTTEERNIMASKSKTGYSNVALGDEKVQDVFGINHERLRRVKGKYDPDCVFNKWFCIRI